MIFCDFIGSIIFIAIPFCLFTTKETLQSAPSVDPTMHGSRDHTRVLYVHSTCAARMHEVREENYTVQYVRKEKKWTLLKLWTKC